MMQRTLLLLLFFVTVACQTAGVRTVDQTARTTDAPTVALINGQWFDGSRFIGRTMHMSGGVFVNAPATQPDSVIDLRGGYVVPPFAEAHNHNFDASSAETARALVARYMKDGVFYGQNPSNVLRARRGLEGFVNVPTGIDV